MKKILFLVLLLGSLIFGAIPCFAASEGNVFTGSDEADEIMKDKDLILPMAEAYNIKQEEIQLDRAIRDYIDIDVFMEGVKSADEAKEYLKNATYIYCIPVFREDADYCLTVVKGPDISEEMIKSGDFTEDEIKYVEERAGRWNMPGISVCRNESDPPIIDYRQKMEVFFRCYGIEESETFFIGGTTAESVITGICFVKNSDQAQEGPYYVALDKIDSNAQTAEDIKNAVYNYDEMKEKTGDLNPGVAKGEYGAIKAEPVKKSYTLVYIIVAAVVVVVAVAVILIVRKNRIGKAKG